MKPNNTAPADKTPNKTSPVWMDGHLVPAEEAKVPVVSNALHYGIAAWEGVRQYSPGILRLRDHCKRLLNSAKILGVGEVGVTLAEIENAVIQTVCASGIEHCYIRPFLYAAEGGFNLRIDDTKIRFAVCVWEWTKYMGDDALNNGIRANVSSFMRHHPNVMMVHAKVSGNYVNSMLARTESLRQGMAEAIMLDPHGLVAECTGANLFMVRDGKIFTPPGTMVLKGITRDCVMQMAALDGNPVVEQTIARDELYYADEVFLTGTACEVVGIREIDHRTVGSGTMGPVTARIQKQFIEMSEGRHPLSAEWLTPV